MAGRFFALRALLAGILAGGLSAGCASVGFPGSGGDRLAGVEGAVTYVPGSELAEPDMYSALPDVAPGLIQTVLANGVLWVGYGFVTVEGGDLSIYNAGEGYSVGMAFGNGEDPKNFFELIFVQSRDHRVYLGTDPANLPAIGDAHHESIYLGARKYLLPVEGGGGNVVTYVTFGLVTHSFNDQTVPGDPSVWETEIESARGLGGYFGTGMEIYFGDKRQVSLGFDTRASYWNWEGRNQDTGQQGTITAAMALAFHF